MKKNIQCTYLVHIGHNTFCYTLKLCVSIAWTAKLGATHPSKEALSCQLKNWMSYFFWIRSINSPA